MDVGVIGGGGIIAGVGVREPKMLGRKPKRLAEAGTAPNSATATLRKIAKLQVGVFLHVMLLTTTTLHDPSLLGSDGGMG